MVRFQIEKFFLAGRVETIKTFDLFQCFRNDDSIAFCTLDEVFDTNGIEHFERPDLPIETPLHGIIDVDHVVSDFRDALKGIDQGVAQGLPGVFGRLVLPFHNHPDFLRRIFNHLDRCDGSEFRFFDRLELSTGVVVIKDLSLAVDFFFTIEASLALVAKQPVVDHFCHERRNLENLAFLIVWQQLIGIVADMDQGVDTNQVGGTKGC